MIHFPSFDEFDIAATFTETRDGNMSLKGEADVGAVVLARRRVCEALRVPSADLVCAEQVHSARIARVDEADRGRGALDMEGALPHVDGLMTNVPGLPLAILTADCVPVFLVAPSTRAVALLHAGRAGTLANISGTAVRLMNKAYGVRASEMHAIVGPSAGPESYEVSEEMAREWTLRGLPADGRRLDLWGANLAQLEHSGIPREQIILTEVCTIGGNGFFSYRRDRTPNRNMAILMLRQGAVPSS